MSLVVCVATNGKIIMAGDTQTNDDNGPTSITATKSFSVRKRCFSRDYWKIRNIYRCCKCEESRGRDF